MHSVLLRSSSRTEFEFLVRCLHGFVGVTNGIGDIDPRFVCHEYNYRTSFIRDHYTSAKPPHLWVLQRINNFFYVLRGIFERILFSN
jgi:hypothetical protein